MLVGKTTGWIQWKHLYVKNTSARMNTWLSRTEQQLKFSQRQVHPRCVLFSSLISSTNITTEQDQYLQSNASPRTTENNRPPQWTGPLSECWRRGCSGCSCMVVRTPWIVPTPLVNGTGLFNHPWYVFIFTHATYYTTSLIKLQLPQSMSNVSSAAAVFCSCMFGHAFPWS